MELPLGSIIMWYKTIAEIPAGWILCNGNNGSPNLLGKYVVGVSADSALNPDHGYATHSHTNSSVVGGGSHVHDVTGSIAGTVTDVDVSDVGSGTSGLSPTHSHVVDLDLPNSGTHQHTTSGTNPANNDPPYLQLYFIMRKL